MNYKELDAQLQNDITYSNIPDDEMVEHFLEKFDHVPFGDETLFIFHPDREFKERNHIISFHQRNSGVVPMHIFHYIVMTYVYQGTLTVTVENETFKLNEGDIIIFDKHVPHSVAKTSEHDLGINIILHENYFKKKFINQLPDDQLISQFMIGLMNNQKTHNNYLVFFTHKDDLVHNSIQNILCEHLDPSVCSDDLIDNFIMILITQLARKFKYNTNLSVKMFKNQELIDDVLDYIRNHYQEGSLTSICHHFDYDPSYMSKLLKKFTGKSFKQLVNEERMKKAIILLHNKDLPIYEIADMVGFSNLTSFYKKFKEFEGCTPQEYRDKHTD